MPKTSHSLLTLLAIFFVAIVLRVWGMDYGLPHPLTRPDEEHLVGRAYHILATGNPHPGGFDWPSFLRYLDTLVLGMYYLVGRALGHYERLWDFLFDAVVLRPGLPYRICRGVSVVFGVVTVGMTYLLSLRAYGSRAAALLAAAALATCHLHVRNSHFALLEVPMTFFIILSLLFALRAADKPSFANFVFSGVFAGLATSTKYNAGLVVLSLVVAGWISFRSPKRGITLRDLVGRLLVAGLGMTLVFALTSPYVVLRQAAVVRDLGNLISLHYQPESEWALWTHLRVTLPGGLGWSFLGVALAGLLRALWLRRTADWVLLAFFLPYFVFISGLSSAFPRYLVPLTPLFAVFGADLINAFPRKSMRARSVVFAVVLVALCGPSLWSSIQFDRLASVKDTRLQAAEWIAQNVAPQTEILLCRGYGAPHINKDRRRPPAFRPTIINCFTGRPKPAAAPYLITHEHPSLSNYSRISDEVRTWLGEQGEQVAVFSPFENSELPAAIFHQSDAFYLPFSGFAGVERGGPIVRIWKLRNGSSS